MFLEEMIYGIQARGSVRLSEVARSLVEETSLKKRIDRLSRNLGRSGLGEDIRVMRCERLKTIAALVLAASFFTAVHAGYKPKLQNLPLHALNAAQRIFGIPDFRYYALADGIKEILSTAGRGKAPQKREAGRAHAQLALFFP